MYLVGFSLSFAELLDILLDLLHDFRMKGWSVAEKEENLHEDEQWSRQESLIQAVQKSRCSP